MYINYAVVVTYTAMQYIFSCPTPDDIVTEESLCSSQCSSNDECATDTAELCCPTRGCGQQCTTPIRFPYHTPVLACPEVDPDMVGTCEEDCADCSIDELCCSNGCGHRCTLGLPVTPICQAIKDSHNGSHRIGEYVPQCEEDGRFAAVQCHGSTGLCWCVDPETGKPWGGRMVRGQPNCSGEILHRTVPYMYMYIHVDLRLCVLPTLSVTLHLQLRDDLTSSMCND